MSTQQQLDDHIIERYTAQPTRLPLELRREIEHAWHGAPIRQRPLTGRGGGYENPSPRAAGQGRAGARPIAWVGVPPPYLAGYLIDRVVRPAQAGTLSLGRGGTIAALAVAAMAAVYLVK